MRIPRPSQLISIVKNIIRTTILYIQYDQWTIDEYFRKQGTQIGKGCSIKTHSLGQKPYLVSIGKHVYIAEGVIFRTREGGVWIFREEVPDLQVYGPIIIEDNCIIGRDAILLPNIRIGKNSIVEPGSVVNSDIAPNSVAIGVPARVISSIHEYKERYINKWKEQKPLDLNIEEGSNWWTSRHWKGNQRKQKKHLTKLFFKNH